MFSHLFSSSSFAHFSKEFFSTKSSSIILSKVTNSLGFKEAIFKYRCNVNASENNTTHSGDSNAQICFCYHKVSWLRVHSALSAHFSQPGVCLGVGCHALNVHDALIDLSLKTPQLLDVQQPQDLGRLTHVLVSNVKSELVILSQ